MDTPAELPEIHALQQQIGYRFSSFAKLETALVHKSFGNEQRAHLPISERDNEQLEFLGDAVLDLAISELLFEI